MVDTASFHITIGFTVHKLKNVTLEVTPEEPQHQQVEVIQSDGELQGLHITDGSQVINSIQQIQVDSTYTYSTYT